MRGIMGGNEYKHGMPSAKSSRARRSGNLVAEDKHASDIRRMSERN